jgi:Immunity protein Imm1
MTATTATLRRSENAPLEEVCDADALVARLNQIAAQCEPDAPVIVSIYAHGYEATVGLGLQESFVHIELESGEPPYLITVGDTSAEGEVAFYLHGAHHTEIPRRNLISVAEALRILREFLETGARCERVRWEEI